KILLENKNNKKINIFNKIKNKSEKNINKNNLLNINFNNSKNNNLNNKNKEIICVTGTSGVGKSIFSINLAKSFMENKNKILIIDFDILNNSLHTILGI